MTKLEKDNYNELLETCEQAFACLENLSEKQQWNKKTEDMYDEGFDCIVNLKHVLAKSRRKL